MQRCAVQHVTLLARRPLLFRPSYHRLSSSSIPSGAVGHDLCGIPTQPTWSVNELLSSYPRPSIPPSTLQRLHELSALIPPAEGTPEHENLTREMEGLVKLVEAVKLVDTSGLETASDAPIPDGRIWEEGRGIELTQSDDLETDGWDLLQHSHRVRDRLYIVDADKRK
ncbi:uncharacterized protein C8Q71DRAFT_697395 [Rhodofomes roseus]|uniref:Uncharacterized protein n=1 Tax=Rhodofomes roseus TaxID=34475 RepID=A0ABQ8KYY6_9APHY|nr:uncharacterized protein C8Q71DRAFT_697395 [Rhodofomes roseus]KAH9843951.1 hypothetical protein C8Q71DRAFT_697395 [Rhodofomes roseus]